MDTVDGTLGAGIGDLGRFDCPNGRRNPVDTVDGTTAVSQDNFPLRVSHSRVQESSIRIDTEKAIEGL